MKRKIKKRIELLELAIKAAEQRIEELFACMASLTCPLCSNLIKIEACDNCPADDSIYTCDKYQKDLKDIQENLKNQAEVWRKEIERLKQT